MRDHWAGREIDGWRLIRLLGRGGMGEVYLAERLGARYALKLLSGGLDPEATTRFLREARALAAVDRHPHIGRIFSLGDLRGRPYLVMELIEGGDLQSELRTLGPGSLDEARRLLGPIASALRFIHARGLVHRDLKPANILLRSEDRAPVLTDFGLVKDRRLEDLTRTQAFLGTPAYMAPEQFDSSEFGAVGAPADVWAFSVMLYELLSGRRPYPAGSPLQIFRAITESTAPELSPKLAGRELAQLCARGLSLKPADRPSMAAFEKALYLDSEAEEDPRRPGRTALVLLLSLVAAALLLKLAWTSPPPPKPPEKPPPTRQRGRPPAIRLAIERFVEGVHYASEEGLSGRVEGEEVQLSADGVSLSLGEDGGFCLPTRSLREMRLIELRARDLRGRQAVLTLRVQDFDSASARALEEVERWRIASEPFQKEVLRAIARRSGDRLVFQGLHRFNCAGQSIAIGRFRHKTTGIELHLIPGGRIALGLTAEETRLESEKLRVMMTGRFLETWVKDLSNEVCDREVQLSPFFLARCELSRTEARRLGLRDREQWAPGSAELPANWTALESLKEALAKKGAGLRLPSEAEWEFAYRGGGPRTRFFWGNGLDEATRYCVHSEPNSSLRSTRTFAEAGRVNGFGLADIAGHVRELCADDFSIQRADVPRDGKPRKNRTGFSVAVVTRGGDAADGAFWLRATARKRTDLNDLRRLIGFRLAMDLPR